MMDVSLIGQGTWHAFNYVCSLYLYRITDILIIMPLVVHHRDEF